MTEQTCALYVNFAMRISVLFTRFSVSPWPIKTLSSPLPSSASLPSPHSLSLPSLAFHFISFPLTAVMFAFSKGATGCSIYDRVTLKFSEGYNKMKDAIEHDEATKRSENFFQLLIFKTVRLDGSVADKLRTAELYKEGRQLMKEVFPHKFAEFEHPNLPRRISSTSWIFRKVSEVKYERREKR